jgi:hypothetical protein
MAEHSRQGIVDLPEGSKYPMPLSHALGEEAQTVISLGGCLKTFYQDHRA